MKTAQGSYIKALLAALAASTVLSLSPALADKIEGIPSVLFYPQKDKAVAPSDFPDWVSAERAVAPSGELDASVLSPTARLVISRYLEGGATGGKCIDVFVSDDRMIRKGQAEKRMDLARAVRTSGWVFKGRVLAREAGFEGSTPGTLVQVLPETTFKGPANRRSPVYFFIPIGEVPVGDQKICIRNPDYAALPEVDDEVVLLIDLSWQEPGHFVRLGDETGLITLTKQGKVSLPRSYRS